MILARYIVGQFIPPFSFGLAVFSGMLLLDKVFDLIDLLVNKGVSWQVSARMFLLFLPTVLALTIPMAILLACLLTFGRLSEDNEITALRASGLSFKQILWPPLVLAALLSIALIPFNATLVPKAMNAFRTLYHGIVSSDPLLKMEARQYLPLRDIRLYAEEVGKDNQSMRDVFIYQFNPQGWQRIYAKKGRARVENDVLVLDLEAGQMERFLPDHPKDLLHIRFHEYRFSMPFQTPAEARGQAWREFTIPQLQAEMDRRRTTGLSLGPVAAELNLRYAIAFSPLALALLGIPLGIALEKGGRGVGMGASIVVVFLYYLLLILGLTLAGKNALPPIPALWMANVVTAVIGIVLYRRRLLR